MRDAGYFTSAVVVNPQLAASANASRGFDFYYHAEIDYTQPRPAISVSRLLGDALLPSIQLIPEPVELERAPVVTEHAVELIDHTENRPLLLWLHYLDPHDPYDPPTIEPEKRITATATQTRMEARTITRREMYRDAYAREIDYWDSWFKRIVQQLESAGLWENSIVVFWSDHGEEFWEHGDWGHGQTLYNDQVHVPLLIHLPGQTESVQVSQPVSLLDVMPSVLELCDVEHPDDIRGRSLAPVFDGRPEQMPPLHFYLESCSKGAIRKALLQDRYKLIYDLDGDRFSLYDLQEDMAERHDLYGTEHAPDVSHMEEELMEWTELSLAMMAQTAGEAAAEELPPGVRQRLRDMGYIQ
jgi:arylsulfatase A-like enzyme